MEFDRKHPGEPSSHAQGDTAPSLPAPEVEPTGRKFYRLPPRTRTAGGLLYDTLEIAPVLPLDSEGTCEALDHVDEAAPEDRGRLFWSLYGHIPGQGCECIGDFKTGSNALEVARRLFGDIEEL